MTEKQKQQEANDPIDPATLGQELNERQTAVVDALVGAGIPLSSKTALTLHVLGATVLLRMGMKLPIIMDPKELDEMMGELLGALGGGKPTTIN